MELQLWGIGEVDFGRHFGLGWDWGWSGGEGVVTSVPALQGLNLIMQLQHLTLSTMTNALVGLFVHYLSQHA